MFLQSQDRLNDDLCFSLYFPIAYTSFKLSVCFYSDVFFHLLRETYSSLHLLSLPSIIAIILRLNLIRRSIHDFLFDSACSIPISVFRVSVFQN